MEGLIGRPAEESEARIRVRAFTTLRDALGCDEIILNMKARESVHDVLLKLEQVYGESVKVQLRDGISGEFVPFLVMINNHTVPISRRQEAQVNDGDRITILPPIDGG